MSELVIASNEADGHAADADADAQHHSAMVGALRLRTEALLTAVSQRDTSADADGVCTGCGGHTCERGEVDGPGLSRAGRAFHPARDPARDDLRGAGVRPPGVPAWSWSRRPYIVYRSRDDTQLGSHRPRRGWDRVG